MYAYTYIYIYIYINQPITKKMEREINHEHLSNHSGILGVSLDVNETGIYTQDDMKVAVAALAAKLSLKGVDIELESYKLRVVLSHLRITKHEVHPKAWSTGCSTTSRS